jgi:hypothetical protein
MPGFAVQQGATVLCLHTTGRAKPTVTSTRVTLGGSAAIGLVAPWNVTGCTNPAIAGGPCQTALWTAGSTKVTSMGQPLVIQGGTAVCQPPPVPLTVTVVQTRVLLT